MSKIKYTAELEVINFIVKDRHSQSQSTKRYYLDKGIVQKYLGRGLNLYQKKTIKLDYDVESSYSSG